MDLPELVDAAYAAALDDDIDQARDHVAAIALLGGGSLQAAMLAWIDRTLHAVGADQRGPTGVAVETDGTAEVQDIDQVAPEVAWSARMFAARAAGDGQTWQALLMAVPEDATTMLRHTMALLTIMAKTAAAAAEDAQADRRCCGLHRWVYEDPAATDARRAVATQN